MLKLTACQGLRAGTSFRERETSWTRQRKPMMEMEKPELLDHEVADLHPHKCLDVALIVLSQRH
jgi:hypothetical protein